MHLCLLPSACWKPLVLLSQSIPTVRADLMRKSGFLLFFSLLLWLYICFFCLVLTSPSGRKSSTQRFFIWNRVYKCDWLSSSKDCAAGCVKYVSTLWRYQEIAVGCYFLLSNRPCCPAPARPARPSHLTCSRTEQWFYLGNEQHSKQMCVCSSSHT